MIAAENAADGAELGPPIVSAADRGLKLRAFPPRDRPGIALCLQPDHDLALRD